MPRQWAVLDVRRDGHGRVTELSPGARALAVQVSRVGVRGVAGKVNASASAVQTWAKGHRTPSGAARAALQSVFGIEPAAWGPGPSAEPAPTPLPLSPPSNEVKKADVTDHEDPRANAVATLHKLRVLLDEVPPERAHNVANAITASSSLLAKLSGQTEVTESQILRSRAWSTLVKLVHGVLERYPGAAAEIDQAMANYESSL